MESANKAAAKKKILIADDHEIFRSGLRHLLQKQADFDVVGEASDGIEALEMIEKEQPDLVILDLRMPRMGGMEVLEQLGLGGRRHAAGALVLTVEGEASSLAEALALGALGYVQKDAKPKAMLEAVRAALEGNVSVSGEMGKKLAKLMQAEASAGQRGDAPEQRGEVQGQQGDPEHWGAYGFSDRESEVLGCLGEALSNKMIARKLGLSENTVKIHVRNVLRKMKASTRQQAALRAFKGK